MAILEKPTPHTPGTFRQEFDHLGSWPVNETKHQKERELDCEALEKGAGVYGALPTTGHPGYLYSAWSKKKSLAQMRNFYST